MCLVAIIWSNIKVVYYGSTKEDAEEIGFRDDMIYDYLKDLTKGKQNEEILKLIDINSDDTIFEAFKNKKDKTIY